MHPAQRNAQFFIYPIRFQNFPFECHRPTNPIRFRTVILEGPESIFKPSLAGDGIIIDIADIGSPRFLPTAVSSTGKSGYRLVNDANERIIGKLLKNIFGIIG